LLPELFPLPHLRWPIIANQLPENMIRFPSRPMRGEASEPVQIKTIPISINAGINETNAKPISMMAPFTSHVMIAAMTGAMENGGGIPITIMGIAIEFLLPGAPFVEKLSGSDADDMKVVFGSSAKAVTNNKRPLSPSAIAKITMANQ